MRKIPRAARVGRVAGRHRKHRPRPVPKWLVSSTQLQAVARSRCLLVLSVLSGEMPVSDAIVQAKISRGTYYQLETRALQGMLAALNPLASSPAGARTVMTGRIAQLEAQVKRLEQQKRRAQRLWLLSRKSIRASVKTAHRGRWPKSRPPSSSPPGGSDLRSSRVTAVANDAASPTTAPGVRLP